MFVQTSRLLNREACQCVQNDQLEAIFRLHSVLPVSYGRGTTVCVLGLSLDLCFGHPKELLEG